MTSNTPDELLHNIYLNAKRNLIKNQPQDLMEANVMAEDYCNQFATCITRDVLNTADHQTLRDNLLDDLYEVSYLAQIFMTYIDAIDTNADIETEELQHQIISETKSKNK